jgi:hypothetical protein
VREGSERRGDRDRLRNDETAHAAEQVVEGPEDELAERRCVVPAAAGCRRVRNRARNVPVRQLGAERNEPQRIAADDPERREKRREGCDGEDEAGAFVDAAADSRLGA